ncbi:MAG: O-antigen ligase family protein [Thermodesulfobacteriota bacterium]|nr:O-antigen ligase family protein [Thermodesulfobacteriota bacterium]
MGLIQYAVSMGTPSWKVFLSSTYVNRNHFAGYLELCLPLSIGMVGYFKDRGKRGILIYGIILMVISLILTLSRGGWIAAGTALFFMAFLAWKKGILSKKVWTLSVITLIITFVFILGLNPLIERISTFGDLVKEPLTFEKRVIVWKGTMGIIKDNPFLGSGIGTFSYAFPCYRPPGIINKFQWAHNDFLHFTSEMGILFLPLMFWLIFSAFKMGVTTFYKTESRLKRGISFGCTTGILALFIHSIFDFNLHIPANTILFFTFLGMIGAVSKPGGLRY